MILFVFEGANREPEIFESIEATYFSTPRDGNRVVFTYNTNIYSLYSHMSRLGPGADIVDCIKSRAADPNAEIMKYRSDDFAEIYLFFDYDFHHHPSGQSLNIDVNINKVLSMATYFNDETGSGKLYVNYPMIESLNYTKALPDTRYFRYTATVEESKQFKKLTNDYSVYGNYEYLEVNRKGIEEVKCLWRYLIIQNVVKAESIESGKIAMRKSGKKFDALSLHNSQIRKYGKEKVGVLNAFPLFLYDYFRTFVLGINERDVRKYLFVARLRRIFCC